MTTLMPVSSSASIALTAAGTQSLGGTRASTRTHAPTSPSPASRHTALSLCCVRTWTNTSVRVALWSSSTVAMAVGSVSKEGCTRSTTKSARRSSSSVQTSAVNRSGERTCRPIARCVCSSTCPAPPPVVLSRCAARISTSTWSRPAATWKSPAPTAVAGRTSGSSLKAIWPSCAPWQRSLVQTRGARRRLSGRTWLNTMPSAGISWSPASLMGAERRSPESSWTSTLRRIVSTSLSNVRRAAVRRWRGLSWTNTFGTNAPIASWSVPTAAARLCLGT
mmetsp:Transcript_125479/g.217576  ORF Transcript_125479/g.217576 Transcript_125479/m.217576 type:complete len:278 (+) Transcript_125479:1739-2572(+)